jgi:hypothetical protein
MAGRPGLAILLAAAILAGRASPAAGQGPGTPVVNQLVDTSQFNPPSTTSALETADTIVSFIDNAIVRSQVRIYFDDALSDHRPTRGEYIQAMGGLPNGHGPPLPEINLDYQELVTYGEVAILPTLSTFMATPLRWVNPEVNANHWGVGDLTLGLKWAFISTQSLVTTFQLKAYVPTGSASQGLGTGHVSLEPALLLNYGFLGCLNLEGEARFWAPIGGSDFAGDIFRYGLGLSYGQHPSSGMWVAPVIEAVGWTMLSGKELVPEGGDFLVQNAAGNTIINAYAGLRLGLGPSASVYAGYGRCLTGNAWYRDIWRLEFRFFF